MKDTVKKDVMSQFDKQELINIADELGLDGQGKRSIEIVILIDYDIKNNGLPEVSSCSDLLAEYLVAAEYCDENGDEIKEVTSKDTEDVSMPECFGLADERDPSCQRCKVLELCKKERIRTRPPCYGTWVKNDDQCTICIEAASCRMLQENNQIKQKVK